MLIRLLCAHVTTKHVCKISRLNSKQLLRKLQKILGGYFILPHPVFRRRQRFALAVTAVSRRKLFLSSTISVHRGLSAAAFAVFFAVRLDYNYFEILSS